tara:strand:- start:162 stop:359 length:198 start_codon:yes stop_codon:yes gene_type:complete
VTSWLTQLKSKTESRFKEKQFIEIEIGKHRGHIFFSMKIQVITEKVAVCINDFSCLKYFYESFLE